MKELKRFYDGGLNYSNIDFSDYFRSLSMEGRRASFITEEKNIEIKNEISSIISELIEGYTNNESTSIMMDTANDIYMSFLYSLDMALFTCKSHEEAIEHINTHSVRDVYTLGQKAITQTIFECISLLVKVKKGRINFPHRSYNATIDREIMSYLKRYDKKYSAHFTKRVYSYNPVNTIGGYRGILYVKVLLQNLIQENDFIGRFSDDVIQSLCYGFCENNGYDYDEMKNNVYSLVLLNSVFASMAGKSGLEVDRESFQKTARELKKYPDHSVKQAICEASERLYNDAYVAKSIGKLSSLVVDSMKSNKIEKYMYVGEFR